MIENACDAVILSEAKDLLFVKSTTEQILRRSPQRPPQNDNDEGCLINLLTRPKSLGIL
jgi:hypothetical protein